MHYNFKQDLIDGKTFENECADIFRKNGFNVTVCDNKKYDLFVEDINTKLITTIECKRDFMAHKTGNIAIEFESRYHPSGIDTTTADFYFIKTDTKTIFIAVNDIKKLIKDKKYSRIVHGGDGGTSKLYLFNTNILTEISDPSVEK